MSSKFIVNIKAFLPKDEDIIKIIDVCDLKPLDNNWKQLYDSYGNCLSISDSKAIYTNINNKPNINLKLIIIIIKSDEKYSNKILLTF